MPRYYRVDFTTELGEHDTLRVCASNEAAARKTAGKVTSSGGLGLKGKQIVSMQVTED